MSNLLKDLPETLRSVRTAPLFVMRLVVPKVISVGTTPGAFRRLGVVSGGSFEGERLSGEVPEGGNDWQDIRADRATTLDVRLALKTNDGALIAMTYRGVRHGPADVLARVDRGEEVDAQSYYFRISPMFETGSDRYGWLNRVIARWLPLSAWAGLQRLRGPLGICLAGMSLSRQSLCCSPPPAPMCSARGRRGNIGGLRADAFARTPQITG